MFKEDLLAVLQELLVASVITSGQLPTASQLERYQRAQEWAHSLIARRGPNKNTMLAIW